MKKRFICSGTQHAHVDQDTCLNCALNNGQDCGMDYSFLTAFWDWASEKREGIHVTDLTGCLRKSFYEKTRPVPTLIHENLLLFLGTITHSMFEQENDNYVAELKLEGLDVVGRADIIYNDGTVIDLKTTRWLNSSKLPYGNHESQVNIYAQLLREMGREVKELYIQYIDLSGPTQCRTCKTRYAMDKRGQIACPSCGKTSKDAHLGAVKLQIPLWSDANAKTFITERRDILRKALTDLVPPPAEKTWLCNYCHHKNVCGS